jgi:hypothetical protein
VKHRIHRPGQRQAEEKPVVSFRETDKTFVLNKTNSNTIAGLYGNETDQWVGKQIVLFPTEVEFQGAMTLSHARADEEAEQRAASRRRRPSLIRSARPMLWLTPRWRRGMPSSKSGTDFEKENPSEAASRNTKWQMACLEYAKFVQKNLPDLTAADYKGMAAQITADFHVATGSYLPI